VALGLEIDAADARLDLVIGPLSDRARTLKELAEQALPLLAPEVTFVPKPRKRHLRPVAIPFMEAVADRLEALPEDPTDDAIMACFKGVAEEMEVGMGKVAQPVRVAMLGTDRSPGIEIVVRVVGIPRAVERIRAAVQAIKEKAGE